MCFPRCKVRKRGSSKQNPIPPSEDDKTFPPSEESKLAGLLTAMKYVRKEILHEPSSPADSLSRGELADLLNKMKKGKLPESPLLQVVFRSWSSPCFSHLGIRRCPENPGRMICPVSPNELDRELSAVQSQGSNTL